MTRRLGPRRTVFLIASALVVGGASIAGCGDDDGDGGGGDGGAKVAISLIGPRNDKGFSQAHVEGVQQAEAEIEGVDLTAVLDSREDAQARADAIETLAPINDFVVGGAGEYAPVIDGAALRFPDAHFLVSTAYTDKFHENVTSIVPEEGLPAYVAGVVMAELTESGTVGVLAAGEIPPSDQTIAGVREGAKHADASVTVKTARLQSFNDVSESKAAAAAMIADGADQIFGFVDSGIVGVYQAAKASGKDIGVYNLIVPDCESYSNIVGTATLDSKGLMFKSTRAFVDDKLEPGAIFIGLEDTALQTLKLCPNYERRSEIKTLVERTITEINDGTLKVPADVVNPRPSYKHTEGLPQGL